MLRCLLLQQLLQLELFRQQLSAGQPETQIPVQVPAAIITATVAAVLVVTVIPVPAVIAIRITVPKHASKEVRHKAKPAQVTENLRLLLITIQTLKTGRQLKRGKIQLQLTELFQHKTIQILRTGNQLKLNKIQIQLTELFHHKTIQILRTDRQLKPNKIQIQLTEQFQHKAIQILRTGSQLQLGKIREQQTGLLHLRIIQTPKEGKLQLNRETEIRPEIIHQQQIQTAETAVLRPEQTTNTAVMCTTLMPEGLPKTHAEFTVWMKTTAGTGLIAISTETTSTGR